jgi:hypothetical protein
MSLHRYVLPTTGLLLCCAAGIAADPPESVKADEQFLEGRGVGVGAADLLDYFRNRSGIKTDKPRIRELIKRLGDDSYEEREKASAALIAFGPPALGFLREALKADDLEVVKRSQEAIGVIEKASAASAVCAAARLLAYHKPDGAAATLLAYAPFAAGPVVAEEVGAALAAVAVRDGKPDPVVVKALGDESALKRATAGAALAPLKDQRPAVRKLLEDPEPVVRLRVGMALVAAGDKDPIPVLIALLKEKPALGSGALEGLLTQLAGDKAPTFGAGYDHENETRDKKREALEKWWRDEGKGLDLARLDPAKRLLGRTMIVSRDPAASRGKVVEVDYGVIWKIDGLNLPIDAQVLDRQRVLVCEYGTNMVTERDFEGEIVWGKKVDGELLGARRQPNGHTFIVTRDRLLEIDKEGKAVLTIERRGKDVGAAARWPDGTVGLVTRGGEFIRYDRTGKELNSFPVVPPGAVGPYVCLGSNIDLLPDGHVLVPLCSQNRVVEFDAKGKKVWEATVTDACSVMRLPNGHTLVCSQGFQLVSELDRNGKVVRHLGAGGSPIRVRRR